MSMKVEALTSRLFSMWAGQAPGKRKAYPNPGYGRMETVLCVQGMPATPSAITEETLSDVEKQLTTSQHYWATSTQLGQLWHQTSSKIHYVFMWEENSASM